VVRPLIGFRCLITAFQELRRLLKRGFEHAQRVPVYLYQLTVRRIFPLRLSDK